MRFLPAVLLSFCSLPAQEIRIDWPGRRVTAGAALTLGAPARVRVVVDGANPVLYDYRIQALPVPVPYRDAEAILPMAAAMGLLGQALERPDCGAAMRELRTASLDLESALRDPAVAPAAEPGGIRSVAAADTLAHLDGEVVPRRQRVQAALERAERCPDAGAALAGPRSAMKTALRLEGRRPAAESLSTEVLLGPGYGVEIEVTETWQGRPTRDGVFSMKLADTGRPVLFFSAGFLASRIERRQYRTTAGQLFATSLGRTQPAGVGLLQYRIPGLESRGESVGVMLAGGPAVQLGEPRAGTMGFFAGVSLHLWRRVFLTVGLHWAQFADWPLPGDLAPAPRWTARLGYAMTFRTTNPVAAPGKDK